MTATLTDLIYEGTLDTATAEKLENLVRDRKNILIIGPSRSGKTRLLNALIPIIPMEERVIFFEDTEELIIPELDTSPTRVLYIAKGTSQRYSTLSHLIRLSLRMRPSRVVVNSINNDGTEQLLYAMNTGHDGSISTLRASSLPDALNHLLYLYRAGRPIHKPYQRPGKDAIHRIIRSALHTIVLTHPHSLPTLITVKG